MAQVEISLKLNVDLQIKAEREDIPQLTESVKSQVAGAFSPANLMANGQRAARPVEALPTLTGAVPVAGQASPSAPAPTTLAAQTPSKPRRLRRSAQARGTSSEDLAVDFVNDASKWGAPVQSWSTGDKCLWLLYVVNQVKGIKELSRAAVCATLRKHFKQSAMVAPHIVSRELGRIKTAVPALVGEDTTQEPPKWFLTEEGTKHVAALIAQTRSQAAQPTT
jgi:hypothetical protein